MAVLMLQELEPWFTGAAVPGAGEGPEHPHLAWSSGFLSWNVECNENSGSILELIQSIKVHVPRNRSLGALLSPVPPSSWSGFWWCGGACD